MKSKTWVHNCRRTDLALGHTFLFGEVFLTGMDTSLSGSDTTTVLTHTNKVRPWTGVAMLPTSESLPCIECASESTESAEVHGAAEDLTGTQPKKTEKTVHWELFNRVKIQKNTVETVRPKTQCTVTSRRTNRTKVASGQEPKHLIRDKEGLPTHYRARKEGTDGVSLLLR